VGEFDSLGVSGACSDFFLLTDRFEAPCAEKRSFKREMQDEEQGMQNEKPKPTERSA
jgi:hypothetical protein